jgi:hypothetical protein
MKTRKCMSEMSGFLKWQTCIVLLSFASLSGCSTPLQVCEAQATSTYQSAVNLAAVTNQNIARGYAVYSQEVPYQYSGSCYDYNIGSYPCQQNGTRTQNTPVTINTSEERGKLSQINAVLPRLRQEATSGVAACQRQYPAT